MAQSNSSHPSSPGDAPEVVIDQSVEIVGNIMVTGRRPLILRGAVCGHVESDGTVEVQEGGFVRGTISAAGLVVAGRVEGTASIAIQGLLDMRAGGELIGKRIAYGDLQHARGAKLTGELEALEATAALLTNKGHTVDEPARALAAFQSAQAEQVPPLATPAPVSAHAHETFSPIVATYVEPATEAGAESSAASVATNVQALTVRLAEVAPPQAVPSMEPIVLRRPDTAMGVDRVPFRENLPPLVSELPAARDASLSSVA